MYRWLLCLSLLLASTGLPADELDAAKSRIAERIDGQYQRNRDTALAIWALAEVGFQEHESSALLQQRLAEAGFRIERGVAGMPTAFLADAGAGSPVVALLAEYDALPGITQRAVPYREPGGGAAGHACGHHLLGTASVAAAIAVAEWLERGGRSGTVRLYGTPAEEGGSGKVYMVRAGLFDDVDAVLSWHPSDRNQASARRSLANRSARFVFHGVSAHAAGAPHRARSALDGVEAFNYMVNLMREHVPQETRIHYVITAGGEAPNVVPDYAEVYYYVRHPDAEELVEIWDRVVAAAEGAAAGTGTRVEAEIMHGNHSQLSNRQLAGLMQSNLQRIGGIRYSAAEQQFAERLYGTLTKPDLALGTQSEIQPVRKGLQMGSTDVGDISWVVPTGELRTATWVPGTPGHSWQAVAAGGTDIGIKGMQLAAKVLALTALDLYSEPSPLAAARQEFIEARGADFQYRSLVGDRAPPLDYRR